MTAFIGTTEQSYYVYYQCVILRHFQTRQQLSRITSYKYWYFASWSSTAVGVRVRSHVHCAALVPITPIAALAQPSVRVNGTLDFMPLDNKFSHPSNFRIVL